MTRQEAIDAAPNSRSTYWSSFVMACLGTLVFLGLGMFAVRKSLWLVAAGVLMGLVMVALGAQAWERLFRPERAAERSASLSEEQMLRIKRMRAAMVGCFVVILTVSIVTFCLSDFWQRLSNELRIFVWTPYMLAGILADLQGERMGAPRVRRTPDANVLQGKLGPLRSDHWGERG